MARHWIYGSEDGKKGVRTVLKIREAGKRQQVLKSAWHNTGSRDRDLYVSRLEVERLIANTKLPAQNGA